MKYNDLSSIQKRLVDAFIEARPELAFSNTITREQVEAIHSELYERRKNGAEKIGYPMWIVKGLKVSRGVYAFPAPNAVEATVIALQYNKKPVNSHLEKEDEEFFEELKKYGII